MTDESIAYTKSLIDFINDSPTAFHTVTKISDILEDAGFVRLSEGESWDIHHGGKYYVTRNTSSVIAFAVPDEQCGSFMITASHTDSPTYKLKTAAEADAFGKYIKLNVEAYGGMIASSWLDRPLSVAGRTVVREGGRITQRLVKIERDLVLIPNVAIHQNRNINTGYTYNAVVDMMPLFAAKTDDKNPIKSLVASELGVAADDVLSSDLYLYNRTPAVLWGLNNEFFSAPRIDNLQCAYSTLMGFVDTAVKGSYKAIAVYSSFDNEETGSATKQGAGSMFLSDTLERICTALGTDKKQALASSFMASADNAHARHPNHPELSDAQNAPDMNGGIVIKSNAAQKYTTDALSAAVFAEICKKAGVPVQCFANRSDMAGGSTLGSISNTNVALCTVDIGLAQLAMHSSYETAGVSDTEYMIRAAAQFYKSVISYGADSSLTLV